MNTLVKLANQAGKCGVRLNPLLDDSFGIGSLVEVKSKVNVNRLSQLAHIAALRPPAGSSASLPDVSTTRQFDLTLDAALKFLAGKLGTINATTKAALGSVSSVVINFGPAQGYRADLVQASQAIAALEASKPNFWNSALGSFLRDDDNHVVWGEVWVDSLSYTFTASGGGAVDVDATLTAAGAQPLVGAANAKWSWTSKGVLTSADPVLFGLETAQYKRVKGRFDTTS